jgi:CPA1 family monovalent cation:H+ antiporter
MDKVADQSKAVLIGARRAQSELDDLLSSGLLSRREHAARWAVFQRDIIAAERTLRERGRTGGYLADQAVLSARKAAILDAARRGLITEQTAGDSVAELDKEFLRTTTRGH